MFDAGGNNLTPGLRFPENFTYFSGRGIGSKIPIVDFFPPQHIPHRSAHQANFPVIGPEKRGDFPEYRVNGQKNSSIPSQFSIQKISHKEHQGKEGHEEKFHFFFIFTKAK
jgi:hypothetical protein